MKRVINMKKHRMTFVKNSLRIVLPPNPAKGIRYTKPVCNDDSDENLNYIYNIIAHGEDWVNPASDGRIWWELKSSCTSNSDEEIE